MGKTKFDNGKYPVEASADMGWLRKASNSNSMAGFGHLIGQTTRLPLAYRAKVCHCSMCAKTPKGEVPRDHNCSINFTSSAGAMESQSILECVIEISYDAESNLQLVTLCTDRDATTAALCRHKKSKAKTDVGRLPVDIE
jgi:hypothetical protein